MVAANVLDVHFVLSLFHVLFVAPVLFFVGFQRAATPKWVYLSLLSVGMLLLGYHTYKFLLRWGQHSPRTWIHLIHVATIAPLLMYIGFHQINTPRFAYELLLLLAFGMTGYHLFQLVRLLDAHPYQDEASST